MEKARVREARESVRQARINLERAEEELGEALKDRFWIEENQPAENGTVIRFVLGMGVGRPKRQYAFAGIKAAGTWHITGENKGRKPMSWKQLWDWINTHELVGGERGFVVFAPHDTGLEYPRG